MSCRALWSITSSAEKTRSYVLELVPMRRLISHVLIGPTAPIKLTGRLGRGPLPNNFPLEMKVNQKCTGGKSQTKRGLRYSPVVKHRQTLLEKWLIPQMPQITAISREDEQLERKKGGRVLLKKDLRGPWGEGIGF